MMVDIYKLNVSARLESVENFSISELSKELIMDFNVHLELWDIIMIVN